MATVDVPSHALPKALFRGLLPQAHSARTASVRVLRIVPSPPEPEPLGRQPTTEAGEEGFDALERAGAASAKRSAGADTTEPTGLHFHRDTVLHEQLRRGSFGGAAPEGGPSQSGTRSEGAGAPALFSVDSKR